MNQDQKKIVVKVEIHVLLGEDGTFDRARMERLTMILSNMVNSGAQIFIVSSGAIFLGAQKLGLGDQPEELVEKQAIAAVGQAELMKLYHSYFEGYNQTVAQVLLTGDIFSDPVRREYARNTLTHLSVLGVIPVINENDSVSTEDIELNDNYYLVRNVADLIGAHLLLIKGKGQHQYVLITRDPGILPFITEEKRLMDDILGLKAVTDHPGYTGKVFPDRLPREILQT